jgi:flagellar motor component MotA
MGDNQYFEDTYKNRRIMQRTLREIDYRMLSLAMVDLTEEQRQFVYLNMSQRAAGIVEEELKKCESDASEGQIRAAAEFMQDIHSRIIDEMKNFPQQPPATVEVDVRVSTKEEIIDTMFALAELAQTHGLLAIDQVDATADPLLTKGLQLITDGTDPGLVESVLERTKQTLLRDYGERLSMIIDGVKSIQFGDHPRFVAKQLEAYKIG